MDLRGALQRPRLIAAVACFVLGAALLAVSLVGRLAPAATASPPAPALAVAPLEDSLGLPAAFDEVPGDEPAELIVYVTGAVLRPDVYLLAPGARVKDAVVAAGGLAPDAAAEQVNLARSLGDADHIHIPTVAEESAPLATAPAAAGLGLLDLNTASEADLEELPGVGKTLSARIIARRAEAGPYTAVEELSDVTGIGEKLYAQIAPLVTVGP